MAQWENQSISQNQSVLKIIPKNKQRSFYRWKKKLSQTSVSTWMHQSNRPKKICYRYSAKQRLKMQQLYAKKHPWCNKTSFWLNLRSNFAEFKHLTFKTLFRIITPVAAKPKPRMHLRRKYFIGFGNLQVDVKVIGAKEKDLIPLSVQLFIVLRK